MPEITAREITLENARAWLAQWGYMCRETKCRWLGGGVSNIVILAESSDWRVVIKQSLGRLRVAETWESDRERIFREAAALEWLGPRLPEIRIPKLMVEDEREFAIAMEAAPDDAEMWKAKLFRGELSEADAEAAGDILGRIIRVSWGSAEARELFGDQAVFDQLRIEPYYRFTARRHPELAGYFDRLIERSAGRAVSIVHGDWSPKNLLIAANGVWPIDWEVVHFGDPAFDVGFLLNHLLLKSIALPQHRAGFAKLAKRFLAALADQLPAEGGWVVDAGFEHLPALLLARVDGKSPAEYLDEAGRERARRVARSLMASPAASVEEVFGR